MDSNFRSQVEIPDGTVLLRPGETPEVLYVIRSGQVVLNPEGLDRRFVFGPGAVVGLSWLIDEDVAETYRSEIVASGPVTADILDVKAVTEQMAGLSPRMRICLISMLRQIFSVVTTENQTDERLTKLVRKSSRELDKLLESRDADPRVSKGDPLADALDAMRSERR